MVEWQQQAINKFDLSEKQNGISVVNTFSIFFNLIPEGVNKQLICKKKRIDRDDYFGILLEVAGGDTIGAVKVIKMNDHYRDK